MTATERKRAERARRKAAGEVRLELWAPAALHQRIREAAQQIIAGGMAGGMADAPQAETQRLQTLTGK